MKGMQLEQQEGKERGVYWMDGRRRGVRCSRKLALYAVTGLGNKRATMVSRAKGEKKMIDGRGNGDDENTLAISRGEIL
ncbi:hypothetical protein E2C01_080597 [Portunus trituberculatus]|uniref:Uncharacterized protein n=1 Tax=Portunus trituberculatus TaxID=210409 RepID=A0A5B7IK40_PORTR|nr:hypothetical protein [Portunus trituberculatus]